MKAARWLAGAGLALAAFSTAPAAAADAMIHEPVARLQGLDKITARIRNFPAPVGTPVRFHRLVIVVRDCATNPPEDPPESAAFLQISETGRGGKQKQLFSGWMFASSPALSALQNPVYDVELLACTAASTASPDNAPAGKTAAPERAAASSRR
ncbi:MAG: DUF2155 domain-containing protein [Stellaceae bacterium]